MTAEAITAPLAVVKDLVAWVVEFISGNAILMVFFVGGLIPLGVKVFKSLKRAAKQCKGRIKGGLNAPFCIIIIDILF